MTSTDPPIRSTLYSAPEGHGYLNRVPGDRHHRNILAEMIGAAGLRSGDTVVEIGAGSGRYTEMLVRAGLRVIATEPDARFVPALESRIAAAGGGDVLHASMEVGELRRFAAFRPRAVMGFHVLHHLDVRALEALEAWLAGDGVAPVLGAAFLEPNPWNPMYAIQIGVHPAMRFREERGLWSRFCGPGSACPSLRVQCNLGLLPPGLLRGAPALPIGPLRSPSWAPWSAYRLIARSSDR